MSKVQKQPNAWFWQTLDEYLATTGLKQTQQRKSIVKAFLTMEGHISAEDLHEKLKKTGIKTGLATIYRTLNLLHLAGLVEQKQFVEGKAVYEVKRPNSHHDHLICIGCRKIIEFENDAIEKLQTEVARHHKFTLVYHSLDLFGYCENCKP
jgi:Fur family transcriptional regulator, ferric uptake regulator